MHYASQFLISYQYQRLDTSNFFLIFFLASPLVQQFFVQPAPAPAPILVEAPKVLGGKLHALLEFY